MCLPDTDLIQEQEEKRREKNITGRKTPSGPPSPSFIQHPNKSSAHNHMASAYGEKMRGGVGGIETETSVLVIHRRKVIDLTFSL